MPKGYRWKQFEDEVKRYIRPPGGSQTATSLQPNVSAGFSQNGNATPDANVADEKDPKATDTNGCSGVADDAPLAEDEAWLETIKIEKENREATAATEKMVRQEENIARKMEEMWDNNSWEIMGNHGKIVVFFCANSLGKFHQICYTLFEILMRI